MLVHKAVALALGAALTCLSFTNRPAAELPAAFQRQLAAAHMQFRTPGGTVPVPVVENAQMNYDYAVRYPGRHLEIRYAIRPLHDLLADFRKSKGKKNTVMADPNELYPSLLTAIALNVSGGQMPQVNQFPTQAVGREFNADWGGTTVVRAGEEFAKGYAACMVVALHKKNVADAYCFYLFDKREDIDPLLVVPTPDTAAFHALRFQ
ncbi:hypothetical protein [Hymenobacter chitinivorans]|uniref:Uncharacterized protein n=1 Tax=Hymenobacter chitinivorans DSM 11115 TaxID=1121954 RepID=A0A2M9BNK4_9BACT|nr:hypothetical protein [Hymenobacter chitinivorans]PJJ59531.1 hypothetical protein CLV45_0950 [Hymenobacter chitinivorans DSM 11115]